MTTDDLAKLRSLAEAATPGPWEDGQLGARMRRMPSFEGNRAWLDAIPDVLALVDAAALGLAWNRVQAALPEGWAWRLERADHEVFHAEAGIGGTWLHGVEPTPTAALLALAEKLEARA